MKTISFITYHDYNEELAAAQLARMLPGSVYVDASWLCYSEPMHYSELTTFIIMDNLTHMINNFILSGHYDHIIVNFPFDRPALIAQLANHVQLQDYQLMLFALSNTTALEDVDNMELMNSEYECHYVKLDGGKLLRSSQIDTTNMSSFRIAKIIEGIILR